MCLARQEPGHLPGENWAQRVDLARNKLEKSLYPGGAAQLASGKDAPGARQLGHGTQYLHKIGLGIAQSRRQCSQTHVRLH